MVLIQYFLKSYFKLAISHNGRKISTLLILVYNNILKIGCLVIFSYFRRITFVLILLHYLRGVFFLFVIFTPGFSKLVFELIFIDHFWRIILVFIFIQIVWKIIFIRVFSYNLWKIIFLLSFVFYGMDAIGAFSIGRILRIMRVLKLKHDFISKMFIP